MRAAWEPARQALEHGAMGRHADALALFEAAVAAGPVGAGAGENATAEILTFVRSKGLYAGATLDGTVIQPAAERNAAYYGSEASAADILVRKTVRNAQADGLREDLARTARATPGG